MRNHHSTGLALGGGATLGAAHVGVLKALTENNFKPDYLSGTSIGALVAALYAFDVPLDEIEDIALGLDWLDVAGLTLSKLGLLSNEKLGHTLEKRIGKARFEDAEIPLAIVATDIGNGEEVILQEGDLIPAVMASACIPGLFIPIEYEGRMLVDGGLVDNVPVSPLRAMGADFIVAVDLSAAEHFESIENIVDVLVNTMDIVMKHSTRLQTEQADLLITPNLSDYNPVDTKTASALIEVGYKTARVIMDELSFSSRSPVAGRS